MPQEDVTTKFKVDISDLKKGITEANQQMKLANAQFKATSAGMEDWGNDADGLAAKLKQLDSILQAQKSKVSNYAQQLRTVSDAEKENGKRAEELRQKYQQAVQQYGSNSAEARKYRTALSDVEREQERNGKSADNLRVTLLNAQAAVSRTEREIRQYNNALDDLDHAQDDAGDSAKDVGEKIKDGFTVAKGAVANFVSDIVGSAIDALKNLAIEGEDTFSKFQASTGVGAKAMGEFKKEMSDLYKNDYGDSLEDVADSMAKVKQVTGETDPSKLKEMTQYAINLRDTFGSDFDESIRGINNLMYQYRISSEEAFDLFAKGSQVGLDYTDELGDNVAEYSGNFKQAGYSAGEYFQLLENGTSNGAYNLDKVNDAINEATNKLADGSVEKNLDIYSKGTQDLFKKWQKGGASQKDVIDSIVKDINKCKNEQDALTMASTLFGTMGEDSNLDFIKSLTSVGDTFKDVKGTMESVDKTRWDNTKAQLVMIKRGFEVDVLQPILNAVVPALAKFGGWFLSNTPMIVSSLAAIGTGFAVFKIATNIGTLITAFQNLGLTLKGLGIVLATNPIGWAMLLAGAVGGITAYTLATKKATDKTDELTKGHEKLRDELEKSDKSQKNNTKAVEDQAVKSQSLLGKLKELMGVENKSASQKARIKDIVKELNGLMPDLNLHYQEEKDKLDQSYDSIQKNIDATRELMRVKATEKNMEATMSNISKIEAEQAELTQKRIDLKKKLKKAEEDATAAEKKQGNKGKYSAEGQAAEKARAKADKLNLEWYNVNSTIKENEKSLKKYYKEYDNLDNYKIGEQAKVDLGNLTEQYKKQGLKIPKAIADGIESGKTEPQKAADQVANLMSFQKAVKKAGIDGKKVPVALTAAVTNGSIKTKTAIDKMQAAISFEKMVKDAGISGKKIPEKIMAEVLKGKKKSEMAAKEVIKKANSTSEKEAKKDKSGKIKTDKESKDIKSGKSKVQNASKETTKAGNKSGEKEAGKNKSGIVFLNKAIDQINKNSGKVKTSAKGAAKEGKKGFESVDTSTSGNNFVQGFINGMSTGSILGAVFTAAFNVGKKAHSGLKKGQKEGSPSKLTTQSGKYFGQGFVNGIVALGRAAINAATGLGDDTVGALNKSLDIHSPSGKGKKSGKNFTKGFVNGILSKKERKALKNATSTISKSVLNGITKGMASAEKDLVTLMGNVLDNVANTAKRVVNGKFTDAGNAAAEAFSNSVQAKLKYSQDKITYQYEQNLAKFDSKIKKEESAKSDDLKAAKKKRDKALKKLKKSEKYKKASKKSKKKMRDAVTDKYAPGIKDIEKAYDKSIKSLKNKRSAYQKAAEKSLADFTDAMTEFGSKAEQLVADTINGITETYQARWDELTNLQDTMTQKLKGFGDLFEISSANVITVNDIQKQTEDIKAYMASLNTIKGKVSEELFNQIATYDVDQGKAFMDQLLSMSDAELQAYNNAYTEKMNLSEQLSKNLYKSDFDKVANDYDKAISSAFSGLDKKLEDLGKQCMSGFLNGFKGDTSYLTKEVKNVANSIINSFKDELKIKSPSRVFGEMGDFSAVGYVQNFVKSMERAKDTLVNSVPVQAIKKATADIKADGLGNAANTKIVNFNQTINSPKPLSRLDIYRQTKNGIAYVM